MENRESRVKLNKNRHVGRAAWPSGCGRIRRRWGEDRMYLERGSGTVFGRSEGGLIVGEGDEWKGL